MRGRFFRSRYDVPRTRRNLARARSVCFKIRTDAGDANLEFTSQLFFDDAVSHQVFARAPYAAKGQRDTLNANDNIFGQAGKQLLLDLSGDAQKGYSARFEIGLQMA